MKRGKSSNYSHGEDDGYEEDGAGWRNERYRERRSHRRYGGRQREIFCFGFFFVWLFWVHLQMTIFPPFIGFKGEF